MNAQPELIRRKNAVESTLARYRDKAFDWRQGVHCVQLAQFHLKAMGHKVPPVPRIRSALGAKRALAARDWDSVTGMLDAMLPRIAPAQMLLGDLAVVPGDQGLDAIFICAGPQKILGWREDQPGLVTLDISLDELTGAWRI